ncbi:MAG: MerR family DNA-binding transcriptional regulator [Romboutsia sp.]
MKNLFSIGEVSKIKGITIKALRYYHKMGILIPKFIDQSTGYRYYSIEQFIYIDVIKGCRSLGTSIAELQDIFKECDTDKLLEFLQFKKQEAENNICEMKEVIKNIDILNDTVEYSKDILRTDDIEIKSFDERYIVVAPCKESGSLKELLYYSNLEKVIKEKKISVTMDSGIIYDIKLDRNLEPIYVFNGIKDYIAVDRNDNIKILPKGRYLVLSYSKECEIERISKIFEYVKEHNLKIKSFIEFNLFNDFFNIDSYSCQIQILIEEDDYNSI